ncbi:hypothetical protein Glove_103g64 [Diversispora epigaea]|uniref:Uncharacterized protein n=1 Tax=Diversispora epigaea TaxID=1348612 RepID=A0A397J3E0_9GLOM|nr:hypothetical protein Glove_103g64 [Diversispora epigaea]
MWIETGAAKRIFGLVNKIKDKEYFGRATTKRQKLGDTSFEIVLEFVRYIKQFEQLPENLQDYAKIEEDDIEEIEKIDFSKHPDEKELAVIDMHTLYVRQAYKDLYQIDLELNVGTFIEFSDLLNNHSKIWYLVDDTNPMQDVVSAPPRIIKYKTEELLICKSFLPMVPEDLIIDLIDKVGWCTEICS